MTLSVFHEPWWLNAVSPGGWTEVRVDEDGRTVARLPYAEKRRLGLRLLVSPPLSNRLGPLVVVELPGGNEARLRRFDHLVGELIDRLPPADLVRIPMHPDTLSWLPFHRRGFRVEPHVSYVIDRLDDLDSAWSGIAGRTRRVIRNAERRLEVQRDESADRLAAMVEATYRRQRLGVPYDPSVLHRAVAASVSRERGVVLTAVDDDERVHSSLFCVWDDRRAWYLGGGGDPELRSSGAGSLLMWELIKEAAKHVDRFDFEGSMLPGVEHYFRKFGGRQETYFFATRSSLRMTPVWALQQRLSAVSAARRDRQDGGSQR